MKLKGLFITILAALLTVAVFSLVGCSGNAESPEVQEVAYITEQEEITYVAEQEIEHPPLSPAEFRQYVNDIAIHTMTTGIALREDQVFVSYDVSGIGHGTVGIAIIIGENDYHDGLLRSVAASHASEIAEALLNQHNYLDDYWFSIIFSVYGIGTAIVTQGSASTDYASGQPYRYFDYMEFFNRFNFDFNADIFDEIRTAAESEFDELFGFVTDIQFA